MRWRIVSGSLDLPPAIQYLPLGRKLDAAHHIVVRHFYVPIVILVTRLKYVWKYESPFYSATLTGSQRGYVMDCDPSLGSPRVDRIKGDRKFRVGRPSPRLHEFSRKTAAVAEEWNV